MATKDFFRSFVSDLGDADTAVAADGTASSEFSGWIDTGSYILNAAIGGSLFHGFPNNKGIIFAGDPATGKTFFALGIVKRFLDSDPKARVFYFDTESAVTLKMFNARGIDTTRVAISEPESIETFRNKCLQLLKAYQDIPQADRFPLLIVLDSLSALPSEKEVGDSMENKNTRDMTKPSLIKGTFRMIRLKMAKAEVPMIITNHTYASVGSYVPTKIVAGGMGAQYAADTILLLSKKQDKVDDAVVGNIVHVGVHKSRFSKERMKVDTRILFDGGLDRYYGLLSYAEEAKLIKKVGGKWEFPDGTKAFEKTINANPENYFTQEFLEQLDPYIQTTFMYSNAPTTDVTEGDDDAE